MKKIIMFLFLALPLMARSEELGRLLESVERKNLSLRETREEMKATGFELKEQNLPENTSVEYSPFFLRGADGIASSELIVTQEFDFPSLYFARHKSGKSRMAVEQQRYLLQARDILIEAAMNYITLVKLNKVKGLLYSRLATAEKLSESYAKKAAAGDATSLEVNEAKLQVMTLRRMILSNETEISSIQSAIKNLNGYEPFDCEAKGYPAWTLTGASSEGIDSDAEIKLAASEVESSRSEESVARQSWVPKLTLGYRRNTELEEASHGFVVGASFPLFTSSAKMKAAKARKAAAEIGMDNARQKVTAEVDAINTELSIIGRSLSSFDHSLLDETQRLLEKSVDLGQLTVTEYYTELNQLNERRMEYIESEYEYYQKLCVLYKNSYFR